MSELQALQLLRRIEEGIAGKTGPAYFKQIVQDIARALDAHAAFTSRLLPGRRAAMQAFWVGDDYATCTEYELAGTPCEFVYGGQIVAHARDIGTIFPVDREWFASLGVRSYLGIPVKDDAGEVHGHLAVMDRRERDWHEADVDVLRLFSLRTAAELERLRHERELTVARAEAERANRMKSVFISQMSHELRTPLNGILGYAQLLKSNGELLTRSQRQGLDVIERAGEHLLTLVNDLLDLAKIEAGKLELQPTNVDLPELLASVADLTRVRAERASVSFATAVASDLPQTIRADSRALRQVLLNLLGNAVKFTSAGGTVTLRARAVQCTELACECEFEVQDTGIGIPPDQLEAVFEPFHRVHDSGPAVEGTGLGLAITRQLVATLGGSIAVKSDLGRGSTFNVRLPLARVATWHTETAEEHITGYGGHRRRVLIAEDDAASRELTVRVLQNVGFDVRSASNGQAALDELLRAVPDLIITDLVMPQVDGMELLRLVRADVRWRHLPVIAMSASASHYTREQVLAAGCTAFIAKPVRLPALFDAVGRALDLEWRREPASLAAPARSSAAGNTLALEDTAAGELHELARMGDINGLLQRATELFDVTDHNALLDELRTLAERYDTGAIRRLLEERLPRTE